MKDTPSLNVRRATKADAEMIADLSRVTFYESFASANTKEDMDRFMNEQFTREKLIEEVGSNSNIFLVAEFENNVVGYARLRTTKIPEILEDVNALEIARIYAVRSMIGKGVGSALMKKCIEIAEKNGSSVIWLGVWEKNEAAIEFYKRWGFEKFGEQDFLLGSDLQCDWMMKKSIKKE